MKHFFPFCFLLLFLAVSCKDSKPLLEELKATNKVENSYHCYASTLRMLNFGDVQSLDKLVKDVEKVSIYMMDMDSFDMDQMNDLYQQLQSEENYEQYIEIEDIDQQYYVLGKDNPDKTIFLINNADQQIILDINGHPDFMQLTKAMKEIQSMDSDSMGVSGYSMLMDLVGNDAKKLERRKERRREWEEKKRKKEEEEKQDSIQAQQDSILLD